MQVMNNGGITYKYYFSQAVTVNINAYAVALLMPFTGVMRIAVISSSQAPLGILSSVNPVAQEAAYDANVGECGSPHLENPRTAAARAGQRWAVVGAPHVPATQPDEQALLTADYCNAAFLPAAQPQTSTRPAPP